MTSEQQRLLSAALDAAERGWRVFPLRPSDKRPAITNWEQRASNDPVRIRNYWGRAPFNVGIACGPSKLVVVDLDLPKPNQGPDIAAGGRVSGHETLARLAAAGGHDYPGHTYTVTTRSGGTHLYFTQPDGDPLRNTAGLLGPQIDTRGVGGYVVAAGSVVNDGHYREVRGDPVAALPTWLHAALQPAPPPRRIDPTVAIADIRHLSRYAVAALTAEADRVRAAELGSRNHTLNAAAYALGRLVASGVLTTDDTTAALTAAARTSGLRDTEISCTIRSGLHAGGQRPRTTRPHAIQP